MQSESQENRQQLSILLFLSYEGKSERIDQKIVETQNPCLKSNSVAWIWTSLWLHCFSWSESLAHEIHPTFWGCFVFTSFSLIYLFFFLLFLLFLFLFLFFLFFTNTIVVFVFLFKFWLEVCRSWWFFSMCMFDSLMLLQIVSSLNFFILCLNIKTVVKKIAQVLIYS